jgi:hypothetical protein
MDAPHRIKVKFFVQDPAAVELHALTPIFHRWIQQDRLEGLLLDVADYKHVQDGPGIVLIGHEADYALDSNGGRPGLVYDRKRGWESLPTIAERVRLVLRNALAGCEALENEPELAGQLRFRLDEAELSFVDRLNTSNQPEVYDQVVAEVRPVLDQLYGPAGYTLARASEDARRALTIQIRANQTPTTTGLLAATNGAGSH